MDFSSRLLENAVYEISRLPGIGRRTALRMALYLLKQPEKTTKSIIKSLEEFRFNIVFCQNCHNLSRELIFLL